MTPEQNILIYVTASSESEAFEISEQLLKKKLAACVNIVDNIRSMYLWEGKIESSSETLLLIKTKSSLFGKVREEVKKLHSYSTPCVVSFAMDDIDEEFKNWISENTL